MTDEETSFPSTVLDEVSKTMHGRKERERRKKGRAKKGVRKCKEDPIKPHYKTVISLPSLVQDKRRKNM